MMLRTCPREKDVKELVELGQWSVAAATAAELRAHVDGCRSCRELVLAGGFLMWQARSGFGWLTRLEGIPQATAVQLGSLWTSTVSGSIWAPLVMISAVATLALLGGAVVYLSSEKQ